MNKLDNRNTISTPIIGLIGIMSNCPTLIMNKERIIKKYIERVSGILVGPR
jgi:hypothetical protein